MMLLLLIMGNQLKNIQATSYKFGYDSIFLADKDYNIEFSECSTDYDCEIKYESQKEHPNSILVKNVKHSYYNGYYDVAETWGE